MNMGFALLSLRKRRQIVGMVVLLAVSLFVPLQVRGQTQEYIVRQLSSEDAAGVPCKLNNLGDVAGRAGDSFSGETQATIWNHGSSGRRNLGKLAGGEYSSASGINDAGEIAGAANVARSIVPFVRTAAGRVQPIPMLPGDNCGQAFAINKYGHVVGYSSGKDSAKAVFWARTGRPLQLPTLPGGSYSKGRDLNDQDEIVGTSGSSAGARAVIWTKTGSVRDLGTLPGDYVSEAVAINNSGDVVGYSKGPRGMRAFLWNQTNGMRELGVLPGGDSSRALAISNLGEVVGSSTSTSGDRAFIWTKEAGMMDLNNASSADLGIVLFEAHSINDKGQIIAMGKDSSEGSMGNMLASPQHEDCAPAPPASFLLTPGRR